MTRPCVAGAVVVLATLFAPAAAQAGDEVDYSAPYITVENGELVTKYPAREHEGGAQPADAAATGTVEPSQPSATPRKPWIIAAAVAGVAISMSLFMRRRRRGTASVD